MVTGPPVGRVSVPVPGATNGNPQSVQGIGGYPQRYLWSRSAPEGPPRGSGADRPLFYSKSLQMQLFCTWAFLPPPDQTFTLLSDFHEKPSREKTEFSKFENLTIISFKIKLVPVVALLDCSFPAFSRTHAVCVAADL